MNVEMRFRLNFLATLLRSIFTLVLRHYKRRTRPYQTIAFSIIFLPYLLFRRCFSVVIVVVGGIHD